MLYNRKIDVRCCVPSLEQLNAAAKCDSTNKVERALRLRQSLKCLGLCGPMNMQPRLVPGKHFHGESDLDVFIFEAKSSNINEVR